MTTLGGNKPTRRHKSKTNYPKEKTALKCDIIIEGQPIKAIIDTGAAGNTIISDTLRKKLQIPEEEIIPSRVMFITANGQKALSLGEIEIEMELNGMEISTIAQIVENKEEMILIGSGLLKEKKAEISYEKDLLTLICGVNKVTIPISCERRKKNTEYWECEEESEHESDEESDESEEEFEEDKDEEYLY